MKTNLSNVRLALICFSLLFLQSVKAQLINKALVVPEFVNSQVQMYYATSPTTITYDPNYTFATPGTPNCVVMLGDDLFVSILNYHNIPGLTPGVYKYTNYKNDKKNAARTSITTGKAHYLGMAFDAAGNLYVSEGEWENTNIFKYPLKPTGGFDAPINLGNGGAPSYFGNLVFDTNGNLWVSDYKNNRVLVIKAADLSSEPATYRSFYTNSSAWSAGGTSSNLDPILKGIPITSVFSKPEGLAFDSNGNLWVANNNDNAVNKAPTIVKISTGQISSILGLGPNERMDADPNMSNNINGFNIWNLPTFNPVASKGQLGGMQIDKAINRIYVNDENNGAGMWFDIASLNSISNDYASKKLNIVSTNPGNGQSALFDYVAPVVVVPPTPAPAVAAPLAYRGLIVPEFNTTKRVETYFRTNSGIAADPTYTIDLSTKGSPNVVTTFGNDLYVTTVGTDGDKIFKFPSYIKDPAYARANVSQVSNTTEKEYVGIAFDAAGNLYTAGGPEFGKNKIVVYAAPTYLSSKILIDGTDNTTNPYAFFSNFVFDAAGNLWASDYRNHRIICIKKANLNTANTSFQELRTNDGGTITSANTIQASVAKLFSDPTGLDFDKNGVLWVANNNYNSGNTAPTLVAISSAYQSTILNASSPIIADPNMANQSGGYNVYTLPSSGSGTGRLGGIQIDKFNNIIYLSDKASQSGLVFDLGTIKDIENNFGKYELKIKIDGGNGGIALFNSTKLSDFIFKTTIPKGMLLPPTYIIGRAVNGSGNISESYMKFIDEVAKTGANTIAIPWYTTKHWNQNLESPIQVTAQTINEFVTDGHLSNVIAYCISKDITPILSINDDAISCKDNVGDATTHFNDEVMKFWTSEPVLKLIETNKSHLIINLASKFDNVYSSQDVATELNSFQETYNKAISTLRKLGVEGAIMIDAPDCGQSSTELASIANTMIKNDPKNALVFAANIDWAYGNSLEQIQQKLDAIKSADIPFILDGISSKQNSGCGELDLTTTYPQILEEACSRKIGWMASDFVSNCSPDQQITTDGSFKNLTAFGNDIVNNKFYGLKSTNGCGTTTPIAIVTYTLIPDSNFEKKLIDLGIDTDGINGKVFTKNIDTVTSLDVSNSSISNLSGIEDFTALSSLICYGNALTSLDVSNKKYLTTLNCSYNQISTLNILGCGLLTTLETNSNNLTAINLSTNTDLVTFYCFTNQLTHLDLSRNPNLADFGCASNNLTSLNMKNENNTRINAGSLRLEDNPNLTCIQVDSKEYSDANWEGIVLKDPQSIFQTVCTTLSNEDFIFSNLEIYPNPTRDVLHINNVNLNTIEVHNAVGSLVLNQSFDKISTQNTIDLSGLVKGFYIVTLKSKNAVTTRKVVVE